MPSDSGAIREQCEAATRLIRQGSLREALELIDAAMTRHGEHPALLMKRASLHARAHRFEFAVADAGRAIAVDGSAGMFFQRGRWLMRLGSFEDARADFTRVLEEPNAELRDYLADAARLLRGFCCIQVRDGDGARADALACASDSQLWAVDGLIDRNWLLNAARRCSLTLE